MSVIRKDRFGINGEHLKKLRKKKGLKVANIVDNTGNPYTTIYRIERGQETVSTEGLGYITKSLNISTEELFNKNILYLLPQKEPTPPKKSSLAGILKKYLPRDIILKKGNVFNYNNISEYLQTWYKKNKKEFPSLFNHRILAKELGCKSTSEIVRVIKHGKSPSRMMINRFIHLMRLTPEEAIYLIIISHFSGINDNKKQKEIIDRYKEMSP